MAEKIATYPFDAAEFLDTPEAVAHYIEAVLEDEDPSVVVYALGAVARARGMAEIAREAGLSYASLYDALNREGSPELGTITRALRALELKLAVSPASAAE